MIRGSGSWLVLDGPRSVAVRLRHVKHCIGCGGSPIATLRVTRSGFSVGQEWEHSPECPTLKCGHGVDLKLACRACEEQNFVG